MTQCHPCKLYGNLPISTFSFDFNWGEWFTCWYQLGVSTPQGYTENMHPRKKTSQFRHQRAQPLSQPMCPLWWLHKIKTLHRHLKPCYEQNPNKWRGTKVRPHLQRKKCWTRTSLNNNDSPIAQLTVHVTNSRKNTEAQTRHGTELWAAAFPNSCDKYPTATGQSVIMTEIKALWMLPFFKSMNPLLHTKFMPWCLEIQNCQILLSMGPINAAQNTTSCIFMLNN